ncbi:MAG TPA: hypothetical protein PLJ37_00625 [Chitinophagales bacterium]|nr:hypothetical protein [Chitinophagales bacterium]HMW93455.1 hypothetical protein [Chitinophagales bacterium]HMZ92922.1 hypothetical protein [Chitinophagales bacterium]HNG25889.1 hypothetical protein [Chitinophagales bacterium]
MNDQSKKSIVVIENQDKDGVEWAVSFNGPNPDICDYIRCYSPEDAFKLRGLVSKFFNIEFKELNERLKDAEEIIDATLGWCDSNPEGIKLSKAYLEKWIKINK